LALVLGKTVGELERQLSAFELSEWMAIYEREPFGDVRADLRAGIIAREVRAGLSTGKSKVTPMDFMPIVKREMERTAPREQSTANLVAQINAAMFRAARGNVVIKRREG
jgi:hypothetical protein